eukprot:7001704-Prymnesium_polylepis.2
MLRALDLQRRERAGTRGSFEWLRRSATLSHAGGGAGASTHATRRGGQYDTPAPRGLAESESRVNEVMIVFFILFRVGGPHPRVPRGSSCERIKQTNKPPWGTRISR